ncbi:MAG: C2H2-type zinc finger protein [Candidatus Parvarchaeota archaeon]|nr:C2H2-type zinc finger protein [Candidatus Parvarchaeota archaeon]
MVLGINRKGQVAAGNSSPPASSPSSVNKPAPVVKPPKGKRKYTCEVCGQRFQTQNALYGHLTSVHSYSPDLIKLEQEKKERRRLFNPDNAVRGVKKHSLIVAPFLIILIILVVYFVFFASSNVGISYTEVTYGSLFSKIGGLISSGFSSISTFIADIQNPNLLVTQPQVTAVNSTPTFSSFLTFTYQSNQQVALTTNPQEGTIFYSVYNNGNVPLGPDTANNLLVNISCGSTVSPGAAQYCRDLLTKFVTPAQTGSSPPRVSNANLINVLAPGETKENLTYFDLSCQPASGKLTFPLSMSFLASFLIKNYTAAVISPIEFMSNSFQSQLISSAQAFVPSEPSFNFYSSGPVQIEVYTALRQPILTKIDSIPLEVTIKNTGNYPYQINNLSLYISKEFYPSNPSTSQWKCSTATPISRQGFQFPGSGYWNCYISDSKVLSSGSTFYLDLNPVTSLNGMHFNTMTVIGYVNYNYNESLNMPVVITNQSCT